MERKQYEMSPESLSMLLDAMQPQFVGLDKGTSPGLSERMRTAWKALGARMGFDYTTARPDPNHDSPRFFTAVPLPDHVPPTYDVSFPEPPAQKVVGFHEDIHPVSRPFSSSYKKDSK